MHQFNDRGLAFVEDLPREGRPLVYDEQQRGEIVKAAKTNPQHLDLEFGHWTLDVLLWALAHPHVRFLFQPTYAPWLNLIEPWWNTLRSLALKGRCFQIVDEIEDAIAWATNHWNQNKKPYVWRKTFV